jgi:hypothetical protein
VRLTIFVSSTKEGKTQVGWAIAIGQKMQRWAKANNIPPNGFPYHVLNFQQNDYEIPMLRSLKKIHWGIMWVGLLNKWEKMIQITKWRKIITLDKWLIATINQKGYKHPLVAPLNLNVNLTSFKHCESLFHIRHKM